MAKKKSRKSVESIDSNLKKFFVFLFVGVSLGTAFFMLKSSPSVLGVSTQCERKDPVLSFKYETARVQAGSKATYYVSVTNKDSAGCADRSVYLERKLPASDWTGGFGTLNLPNAKFTVKPGYKKTVMYYLKSPPNVPRSKYTSRITLNGFTQLERVTYEVISGPTPTPTKKPTPTPKSRPHD